MGHGAWFNVPGHTDETQGQVPCPRTNGLSNLAVPQKLKELIHLAEKTTKPKKRAKKFVPSEKHKDKTEPWQKFYHLVEEKLKK